MATAEQYASWIVDNADKRGTPEFETVAEAYRQSKGTVQGKPGEIPTNPLVDRAPKKIDEWRAIPEIGRQLGLFGRATVNAVAGVPILMADAVTGVANQFGGRFKSQGPVLNDLLTKWGLPVPTDATERVLSDTAAAIGGAGGMASAASKAVPMLRPMAEKVGQQIMAAGTGSASASTARENDVGPVGQIVAGLIGGLTPAAAMAAWRGAFPNTTQAGRLDTKGRLLKDAAGDQKAGVLAGLDEAKVNVSNEQPTAAQASAKANSPAFAALEKLVRTRHRPDLISERDAENEAARLAAVKTVGKDEAALNAASAVREANADTNYGVAFKQLVSDDPMFAKLMERPSMKAAFARAKELSLERDEKFKFGETKPARIETQATVDANGVPSLVDKTFQAESTRFPVRSLHKIKKALDDVINEPEKFVGIGESERVAALNTRAEFLKWLADKSAAYDKARQVFAKDSKPINQMQIGQLLEGKLTGSLGNVERPTVFANAMNDAPRTIKSATGGPRHESLSDVLDQKQVKALEGVKNSLDREAVTDRLASLGTTKARSLVGETFSPLEPPPLLHRAITTARFLLEKVGVNTMNKTLKELAKDMQDPAIAAKLMRESTGSQREAMMMVIRQAATPAVSGLLQPAAQVE